MRRGSLPRGAANLAADNERRGAKRVERGAFKKYIYLSIKPKGLLRFRSTLIALRFSEGVIKMQRAGGVGHGAKENTAEDLDRDIVARFDRGGVFDA